jgi:hypothetical protein
MEGQKVAKIVRPTWSLLTQGHLYVNAANTDVSRTFARFDMVGNAKKTLENVTSICGTLKQRVAK